MITRGTYNDDSKEYGLIVKHTKQEVELLLTENNQVASAYKSANGEEYSFLNKNAKKVWELISKGIKGCTSKNATPVPFVKGTASRHELTKSKVTYIIELYNGELCGSLIYSDKEKIMLEYEENDNIIPANIPYIKLAKPVYDIEVKDDSLSGVTVRTVEEIALEKEDISWLKNKKYYIINDDEQAERIFSYLDNYNGVIAYDTETTGLKINCFGKINSHYQKGLQKWNEEHPDDQIRADKLVGIIFCIQPDVSYYFPVGNRKFKNLYEDKESPIRKQLVERVKARYTVGDFRDKQGDMADYIRNTPTDEWTSDIILMERVRDILEKKHIVAHNGTFEWKVGWLYEIDTNLKDDTMILHQLMYKFRSTTSNAGEPSNLKYLAKVELGIDQWELSDFFPEVKDDNGLVRAKGKKKKGSRIDFSYMNYDGARIYAPADGDVTYQLYMKYKRDLIENHKELEYLYNVEVIVACAIGYMEFYGHRIDESKIMAVRDATKAKIALITSEIRQMINYSSDEEIAHYQVLKQYMNEIKEAEKSNDKERVKELNKNIMVYVDKLNQAIEANIEKVLNLASPAQVAKLFYEDLGIPFKGDKPSVAKKEVKALLKEKDENGNPKYPVVHLYSEYKNLDTLLTKFFDQLPFYMYPGGYIFSSYGQISTATGRMSCKNPNAQQYPKAITSIVIPRPGYVMLDADYSQIEYRVLVALAGENKLAELFKDPDNDYHTLMASLMYGVPYASVTPKMRSDAKSFNFGIPYGMGFKSLAILLTGKSGPAEVEEAKQKYELYFKDQPNVRKFFNNVKEMASVNKYTKTFWNRRRYYSFDGNDANANAKRAAALRQAGNAVIQGTAADIFKISVARNFMYIRRNNLLGKLLIVNMVHDEQLFEVDVRHLNILRVLRDLGENMQFKVEGFPPLYIGAGVGPTWNASKGKMAEIHPFLLERISREADNIPLWLDKPMDPEEVIKEIDRRIYEFRRNKVLEYITNPENYGKDLHPAIGNLLNLQFTYGHDKDKEGLSDDEFTMLCLKEFIAHNGLDIDVSLFKVQNTENKVEEEEETEYDDGDEMEVDELDIEDEASEFKLLEDSGQIYGSSLNDVISTFGYIVSKAQRVCGIDVRKLSEKKKEEIIEYLTSKVCDDGDPNGLEIVFLQDANILKRTGIYVKGVTIRDIESILKSSYKSKEFTGTINERLKD